VAPGSEAGQCLAALPEAGVLIGAEADRTVALPDGARRLSRRQLLAALAAAEFQQTF
jgi:hypothetical protein